MSAYPLNAHRIHSGVRVRWYWFVANLYLDSAANLPWNELFILRCVFPVESVLAYGELHVEKLLCRIAYQLHVRAEASPVPCKISDRVFYTPSLLPSFSRVSSLFFFFLFFSSFEVYVEEFRRWKAKTQIGICKFVTSISIVLTKGDVKKKCVYLIFLFLIVGKDIAFIGNRSYYYRLSC